MLTHGKNRWDVLLDIPGEDTFEASLETNEENCWTYRKKRKIADWDACGIASLLQIKEELKSTAPQIHPIGKTYTREGMVKRVLDERREEGIGYAQLTGKVPVKHRQKLIQKFESDASCNIFLSSEAGGSGLNLQAADTVINFELPWNPAKKNQRIGRIDRLGQTSKQLTVINLLTRQSIEMKIASGLSLKQNLFDGVLSDSGLDEVDFSAAGRAEFLRELEEAIEEIDISAEEEDETTTDAGEKETIQELISEEEKESTTELNREKDKNTTAQHQSSQPGDMESVLNHGMEFLSGLMKMTTGKDSGLENKKVEIDKETGEVVMRFKLPGA